MTDRVKGCYVAFTKDMRVDDVQLITNAIIMISGVKAVELYIVDPADFIIRSRITSEIREEMYKIIDKL